MKPFVGLLAAVCAIAAPCAANAFSPYLVVPDPAVAEASSAYRYANMTDGEAFAELDRRSILYSRVDNAPGVRAPIRLTGRLHGVYVHSSLPPQQRVVSYFEILDARLALALDDFCALLERHEIDELVHFTMYRPNVAMPDHGPRDDMAAVGVKTLGARPRPGPSLGIKGTLDPRRPSALLPATVKQKNDDASPKPEPGIVAGPSKKQPGPVAPKPAGKASPAPSKKAQVAPPRATPPHAATHAGPPAHLAGPHKVARRDPESTGLHATTWAPPGTRHPAGLAIDVASFHKRDGRWLTVHHDFHGHLGVKTCGEGAVMPESPDARELHALVCESSDRGTFTYVLTPNYNAAHVDHFHMEIKPGVRWFLYH